MLLNDVATFDVLLFHFFNIVFKIFAKNLATVLASSKAG